MKKQTSNVFKMIDGNLSGGFSLDMLSFTGLCFVLALFTGSRHIAGVKFIGRRSSGRKKRNE